MASAGSSATRRSWWRTAGSAASRKAAELAAARADRVIDASALLVTPGFVNGHMHISYAHAVRGIFPDELASPLVHVFALQDAMTEEEEYLTTLLGLVELLKNGTVCFVDPGSTKFPDACLQAYEDSGIRVMLGEVRHRWRRAVQAAALRHPRGHRPHGGVREEMARASPGPHARLGDAVFPRDLQRRALAGGQAGGR